MVGILIKKNQNKTDFFELKSVLFILFSIVMLTVLVLISGFHKMRFMLELPLSGYLYLLIMS